jgi:hypothetical protein
VERVAVMHRDSKSLLCSGFAGFRSDDRVVLQKEAEIREQKINP